MRETVNKMTHKYESFYKILISRNEIDFDGGDFIGISRIQAKAENDKGESFKNTWQFKFTVHQGYTYRSNYNFNWLDLTVDPETRLGITSTVSLLKEVPMDQNDHYFCPWSPFHPFYRKGGLSKAWSPNPLVRRLIGTSSVA